MQRAVSLLNPGADKELRAFFPKWNAIETGYWRPHQSFARRNEISLRGCLALEIRRYDGKPPTDCRIGGCFDWHKQTFLSHFESEVSGDSSFRLFPEFDQMRQSIIGCRTYGQHHHPIRTVSVPNQVSLGPVVFSLDLMTGLPYSWR